MKKKLLLVYNPRSGTGAIRYKLFDIIEIFTKAGFDVLAHPTQETQDANRTVIQYASRMDMVVCCGGDGTLDEVVNGLMMARPNMPIGYIPTGSTNDFAASLGISKDQIIAAEDIVKGKIHACDIGRFNYRTFVYIAAFGLFTDVAYQTDQNLKNLLGHGAYLLEAGKRIFYVPKYELKIQSDEVSIEDDFVYGMITNATSVGGMRNLPGLDIDLADGLFEVRLVYPPKNPIELSEILTTLLNPKLSSEHVLTFKTRKIQIECDEPLAWTLDGEFGGEHKYSEITNMHKALQIILNAEEGVTHE